MGKARKVNHLKGEFSIVTIYSPKATTEAKINVYGPYRSYWSARFQRDKMKKAMTPHVMARTVSKVKKLKEGGP